ncbi:UvrD-helicase domain-containing protein [Dasania sp. GY-MA-18]|uniref:DNA 3'-5' helicase n=1 Tax=Dasania phycosphaerae TaxID=2950436 RepID=A0A9J6RHQ0_9GAMM|nr:MULTISPECIES: UvrD-helicase domain-containing protein [Dasania]MCR8921770.1 UvrD-helicase domain-containing protein [Dasania sp. GY-MA-18]MCZ0864198.1 UvrD-helicase domain-containing protein [Dasania phycosphaerae]MCZ0867926.1 UvrD-helicase domain-containing protein [Dasania phycosphaerae]
MSAPIDQAQRIAALDPLQSACVTAPAGSGKTELLSQRVLTLLARVDKPEEILAITFTRKAAAEMHHRIIQALLFARDNDEPEEEYKQLTWRLARAALARDKACEWNLLVNTSRLKIQTIDSLCASLTRQMPLLASFGAQPKITDNAEPLYQRAVANLLKYLETDSELAQHLEALLRHVDNDWSKTEKLLMDLLRCRDQWLFHIFIHQQEQPRDILESGLQAVVQDHLTKLQHSLLPWAAELAPLLDYAGHSLQQEHSDSIVAQLAGCTALPGPKGDDLAAWQAVAELLLTAKGEFRKTVNKNTGFPAQTATGDKAEAKQRKEAMLQLLAQLAEDTALPTLLHELRSMPALHYPDEQWHFLAALTSLLPYLVAELMLEFQHAGEVDHSQIALAAIQSLGDSLNPTELRLKLDYQLKHILIDEFQDTASTQFELLKSLLEGWQEHNQANPETPNTLFIVGDGMQSIYGFREANVGLFLEARRQGVNKLPLQALSLQVNFRSTPAIVDWVNKTFKQAFPQTENLGRGAVRYENSSAYQEASDSSQVKAFGLLGDDVRQQEALKVVELVQQHMTDKPKASIAILVRTRNHLNDILPALFAAGIEWQATDINPLSKNGTIIDLLSLTKALLNSADRIAWAALLRAPFIGLDNSDLHILLGEQQRQVTVKQAINNTDLCKCLSRYGQQRMATVRAILRAVELQRGRQSLRVQVHGVWMALGGPACVADSAEYLAVDDYLNLLEQHEQSGLLPSIKQFEAAVARLYAAPLVNDSCLQVMTIHKSKGLEFDTVILPALERRPRSDDKSLLMWREYLSAAGDNCLLMSPLSATGSSDAIYDYLRYEQDESRRLENTRLLYVAATRAIDTLYITFSQAGVYEPESVKAPSKQSLLNSIWASVKDEAIYSVHHEHGDDDQLMIAFDQVDQGSANFRLADDWRPPHWSFANPLADFYIKQSAEGDNNIPDFFEDHFPRQLGNIAHAILEHCVAAGVSYVDRLSDEQKVLWVRRLCHSEGVSKDRWGDVNVYIDNMMTNISNDPKARWLLSSQHKRSDVEYALLSCSADTVSKRVIDRSFVDEEGTRWIVDYKTSAPLHGEPLADFIAKELALYSPQLQQYQLLMQALNQDAGLDMPVKTALYFPAIPHWQEL